MNSISVLVTNNDLSQHLKNMSKYNNIIFYSFPNFIFTENALVDIVSNYEALILTNENITNDILHAGKNGKLKTVEIPIVFLQPI